MFDINSFLYTSAILLVIAIVLWISSRVKNDVAIVDSFWSLMILAAGLCFFLSADNISGRSMVVITLLSIWAIRLSAHITWRNWGKEEDVRYQTIRANNQPNFEFKSLYIVFLLQAFLALLVALPMMSIFNAESSWTQLDTLASALWLFGMLFESVSDYQLARFKSSAVNQGKVMDKGLWRFSRHPNYFGEFCIWWAFFLFAVSSGYWWSILSPLLMSILLLKVSGVSLLESTIAHRRPEYAKYIETTSAFFPWFPKRNQQA